MTQETYDGETNYLPHNFNEFMYTVAIGLGCPTEAQLLQQPGVVAAFSLEGKNVCGFAGLRVCG